MDSCIEIRPELGAYVLGAISPQDRALLVQHLASCRGCRHELAGLAALPGLLRRGSPGPSSGPAGSPPAAGDS